MTPGHIRVVVVESRDLLRAALSSALDAEDDLKIIAQIAHGREALDRIHRLRPDVVCIGATVPPGAGLALCEQIKADRPEQRVLMIDDLETGEVLLAVVLAGAEGYATNQGPLATLCDGVRGVHAGDAVVPAPMLGDLLRRLANRDRRADESYQRFLRLTSREKEVLELLADGCGNAAIAEILVISPQTARTHIQNVVRKLGAHSRLEAAAMASEHGWVRTATARRR